MMVTRREVRALTTAIPDGTDIVFDARWFKSVNPEGVRVVMEGIGFNELEPGRWRYKVADGVSHYPDLLDCLTFHGRVNKCGLVPKLSTIRNLIGPSIADGVESIGYIGPRYHSLVGWLEKFAKHVVWIDPVDIDKAGVFGHVVCFPELQPLREAETLQRAFESCVDRGFSFLATQSIVYAHGQADEHFRQTLLNRAAFYDIAIPSPASFGDPRWRVNTVVINGRRA